MPSLTNIMAKRVTSSIRNIMGMNHGEGIMDMPRRLGAEFFGTFWLTFAGCGSAVLAAGFPTLGHRIPRGQLRLRADRADNGLCGRPHLRWTFQLRGD